ncbi:MAG: helix-turn-helix transcriptional regulator [Oceanipulchritudo sp.]
MIPSSSDQHAIEAEEVHVSFPVRVAAGVKSGHYGYLVQKGILLIRSQEGEAEIRPGQLGWVGGGAERSIRTGGPAGWIVLRIRHRCFAPGNAADRIAWETLLRLATLSRTRPRIPCGKRTAIRLRGIGNDLLNWAARTEPVALPMRKSLLLQFLMVLQEDAVLEEAFQTLPGPEPRMDILQQVLLLIERDAVRLRNAGELARRAGLSRSGLYRLLESAGLPPPATMLGQARMEAAARLLLESRQNVLDVAMECGFGSLSSFYRAFQRAHGTAPGSWRSESHGVHGI